MKPRIFFSALVVAVLVAVLLWRHRPAETVSDVPKTVVAAKSADHLTASRQITAPAAAPVPPSARNDGETLATAGDPRMKLDTTMQYYIQMLQAGDYRAYYRAYYFRDGLGLALPARSEAEEYAAFARMVLEMKKQHPEMSIPDPTPELQQKNEEAVIERMRQFVQGPDGKAALKALQAIQLLPIPEGAESQFVVGFDVPDPDTGENWHVTFHKTGKFWIPYFPPRASAALRAAVVAQ